MFGRIWTASGLGSTGGGESGGFCCLDKRERGGPLSTNMSATPLRPPGARVGVVVKDECPSTHDEEPFASRGHPDHVNSSEWAAGIGLESALESSITCMEPGKAGLVDVVQLPEGDGEAQPNRAPHLLQLKSFHEDAHDQAAMQQLGTEDDISESSEAEGTGKGSTDDLEKCRKQLLSALKQENKRLSREEKADAEVQQRIQDAMKTLPLGASKASSPRLRSALSRRSGASLPEKTTSARSVQDPFSTLGGVLPARDFSGTALSGYSESRKSLASDLTEQSRDSSAARLGTRRSLSPWKQSVYNRASQTLRQSVEEHDVDDEEQANSDDEERVTERYDDGKVHEFVAEMRRLLHEEGDDPPNETAPERQRRLARVAADTKAATPAATQTDFEARMAKQVAEYHQILGARLQKVGGAAAPSAVAVSAALPPKGTTALDPAEVVKRGVGLYHRSSEDAGRFYPFGTAKDNDPGLDQEQRQKLQRFCRDLGEEDPERWWVQKRHNVDEAS